MSENALKVLFWITSIFKIMFLHEWRLDFHRGPNRKNSIWSKRFVRKDFDFLPSLRSLMVQRFQKVVWNLIYLVIQTQFFPNFQVWFVPSRFQSNSLELWQSNRLKNSRRCSLHQNPDGTNDPKTAFWLDVTCYSNLIFSVATGLDSPIIVSIESFILVEEDPIEAFFLFLL